MRQSEKDTILKRAEKVRSFLTTKEVNRQGEEQTIWTKTDDAPYYVTDLIRAAHGDMLPDDFKYQFVVDALDALIENSGDRDNINFEPDIYNRDLLNWLNSSLTRASYVDEAAEEYGLGAGADLYTRIGYGQTKEKDEVLSLVIDELSNLDELDEENDEESEA